MHKATTCNGCPALEETHLTGWCNLGYKTIEKTLTETIANADHTFTNRVIGYERQPDDRRNGHLECPKPKSYKAFIKLMSTQ